MLNWANQFSTFCFLDNHHYQLAGHSIECVLAAGVVDSIALPAADALHHLQPFLQKQRRWLFGHLAYDLKNEIEHLQSAHGDSIQFPDLFFFQPETIIWLHEKSMRIESIVKDAETIFLEIMRGVDPINVPVTGCNVNNRINRDEYVSIVGELKSHILRGDCYEINFCQEFFSENVTLEPLSLYKNLSVASPNPFSGFYRVNDKYLLCASPERFLKKQKNKILSQPIKGTSSREKDQRQDEESRINLRKSPKERSENVMIVDLVRNDLSKICVEGSVQAEELFGIYSFPQVHQMISTVSGTLRPSLRFSDIIRATFPMGSMTGAPKKRVLELIEKYEKTKRGIFSGALGYIDPNGDFDFNVVIRSIMYNASLKYLSFQTGSGITFYSDPEKEWEECMLKAHAIKKVLQVD